MQKLTLFIAHYHAVCLALDLYNAGHSYRFKVNKVQKRLTRKGYSCTFKQAFNAYNSALEVLEKLQQNNKHTIER
jgi:hypothetical protein